MSELSCDTLFIGRNETHDLSRYHVGAVDAAKSAQNGSAGFSWINITCIYFIG